MPALDATASNLVGENSDIESGAWLLCVPAGWDSYISLEFHEIHQLLVALGWHKWVIGEHEDARTLAAIGRADAVLLWETYELLEREADAFNALPSSILKIVFCDDVHHFTPQRRQQRLRAFCWADRILATYPDKLLQWYPEVDRARVRWTPHAAASCFQPGAHPTSERLLLSGSRTWPYPFRQFCHAKLPATLCETVDHPGYPGYPGDRANTHQANLSALATTGREAYAVLLRNHPAMLVCGSVFSYLVAKVFEAMAAGCLVIAERTTLGERLQLLGFIEGEHYVGTDILHAIEDSATVHHALQRGSTDLTQRIERARLRVAEYHSTAVRAEQIHRYCLGDNSYELA